MMIELIISFPLRVPEGLQQQGRYDEGRYG
jgi:hypothetical protein